MLKSLRKILPYLCLPIVIFGLIFILLQYFEQDINHFIDNTQKIIQSFAIIIGGIWAYEKFFIQLRMDAAMSLRIALRKFDSTKKLVERRINEEDEKYSSDLGYGRNNEDFLGVFINGTYKAYQSAIDEIDSIKGLPIELKKKSLELLRVTQDVVYDHEIGEITEDNTDFNNYKKILLEIEVQIEKIITT